MQCGAVSCGAVWCGVVRCGASSVRDAVANMDGERCARARQGAWARVGLVTLRVSIWSTSIEGAGVVGTGVGKAVALWLQNSSSAGAPPVSNWYPF